MSKITTRKQDGGVAQVVEHLLCEHKAMNKNSSSPKNKTLNASAN
jgi:hypothetical protein